MCLLCGSLIKKAPETVSLRGLSCRDTRASYPGGPPYITASSTMEPVPKSGLWKLFDLTHRCMERLPLVSFVRDPANCLTFFFEKLRREKPTREAHGRDPKDSTGNCVVKRIPVLFKSVILSSQSFLGNFSFSSENDFVFVCCHGLAVVSVSPDRSSTTPIRKLGDILLRHFAHFQFEF